MVAVRAAALAAVVMAPAVAAMVMGAAAMVEGAEEVERVVVQRATAAATMGRVRLVAATAVAAQAAVALAHTTSSRPCDGPERQLVTRLEG
jgi:putative copper export protein